MTGCCWTLYSLHRSTGRLVTTLLQQEIEKDAMYLSSLFRISAPNVTTSAAPAVVVKGAVTTKEGAASEQPKPPTQMELMEQRLLNDATLRGAIFSQYDPQPPAAPIPIPAHASATSSYKIDFSNLDPDRNHAIIIPYRNRKFHLEQFIAHMGPYLNRNFPNDTFELWIMEQGDNFLFNRAWLVNVGIASIKQQNRIYHYQRLQQRQTNNQSLITVPPPPRCIILHDVDLIPTVDGVPYTNCSRPMQLGTELAHFNDSIPYALYTGGVGPTMTMEHWVKINGMSNDFYGKYYGRLPANKPAYYDCKMKN
jgi:N-terminal region of glycosyl transferase group 7/N-terminal domain of galactosyltransferase